MGTKLTKLKASLRKRIGYCEHYHLPVGTDATVERLQHIIRDMERQRAKESKLNNRKDLSNGSQLRDMVI